MTLLAWARPTALRARVAAAPVASLALAIATVYGLYVFALQLAAVRLPITVYDGHHWRQAFTYGVAWNYAHETLDPLHPRMFVELAKSNVVPMESSLYPLVTSFLFRLTGDSVAGPRALSLVALAVTIRVLWGWLGRLTKDALPERAGLVAALALSPMVAIEFRALQPEPVAAGLAAASAWYCARYRESEARRDLILAAAAFGLSMLVKPIAFGIVLGLVALATWEEDARPRARIQRAGWVLGAFVLAALPAVAWDRWAHFLLARDLGGHWVIQIEHEPKHALQMLLGGAYSREACLRGFAGYATSSWLVPAVALGVYRGLADRAQRRWSMPLMLWMVGYLLELLAVGERLHSNAYYFILAAAPMAWFAALGVGALLRFLEARTARPSVVITRAALCLLVMLPLGGAFARGSNWSNTTDGNEFGFERNRALWVDDLGAARLVAIIVLAFALGHRLRPRRVPLSLGVFFMLGCAASAYRPARDQLQYFRYYTALDRRAGLEPELNALRAVVDRYSAPSDRVVMSPGGTYREPSMVLYYYVRRNGFGLREKEGKEIAPNDGAIEMFRSRGAKLWVQIDAPEKVNHARLPGKVLGEGSWWKVGCLAADGCPAR